jgi:alpha-ketoglutarate-dependent taurine dioxygenase
VLRKDLLGVLDVDVWTYGEALRALAQAHSFNHIEFARINDVVHLDLPETINEMTYVVHASRYRSSLIEKFGRSDWNVSKEISENQDACLTYRGYIKFLMTDLADMYPLNDSRSAKSFKRGIEYIAKQMLGRGQAFSHAIRENFPNHLRLSIHPSAGDSKLPVSLLPTDSFFTTPWHCAVAFALDGTLTSGHRAAFDMDSKYELVYDSFNRPSHYIEKVARELLDWTQSNTSVTAEPIYPCGWMIRPSSGVQFTIDNVDAHKLRALAEHSSPVVLRGFQNDGSRDKFVVKAHELGKPLPWMFGLVLEVKDHGINSRGMNNTLSAERMPFHYDGVFKTKTTGRVLEDGSDEVLPDPPRFQFFTAVTESPPGTGYTIFAASSRLLKYLPSTLPLERLQRLTWSVKTKAWNSPQLRGLKLIEMHPSTGKPILRYHEPWPQSKTAFEAITVNIEGVEETISAAVCATLDSLLHDRRVCYWHEWEQGDLLVSDNMAMLHTRTGFTAGSDRELWRIHVD